MEAVKKHKAEIKNGTHKPSKLDKLKGLERYKFLSVIKGSHKIDIAPITPKDGIKTGIVIAYGHVIKPPYKIYYEGDNLMINNVQVRPSLVRERARKMKKFPKPFPKGYVSKSTQIDDAIKKMYMEGLKTKSVEEVQDEITEFILKSSDVYVNPKWTSDETMRIKFTGSDVSGTIRFRKTPLPKISPEAREKWHKKRKTEMHESMIETVKFNLKPR
jgi:hypothetical protein